MRLFELHPEVAGGFGPNTVIRNSDAVQSGAETLLDVVHLEYRFEDWAGDDLVTSFPCFIVTERLAAKLKASSVSGLEWDNVEVTTSPEFHQRKMRLLLPPFERMCPKGTVELDVDKRVVNWSGHDACISATATGIALRFPRPRRLVVTERMLNVLREYSIKECSVKELNWASR
jgi:hypothetical protein